MVTDGLYRHATRVYQVRCISFIRSRLFDIILQLRPFDALFLALELDGVGRDCTC
jgi:hypothetical protein